jgi:hypothetical protein
LVLRHRIPLVSLIVQRQKVFRDILATFGRSGIKYQLEYKLQT